MNVMKFFLMAAQVYHGPGNGDDILQDTLGECKWSLLYYQPFTPAVVLI